MSNIEGLSGVAALERTCIRPGYWVVESWDVRRRGKYSWEGTLSFTDSCRVHKVTGETLRQVCERIAEVLGRD